MAHTYGLSYRPAHWSTLPGGFTNPRPHPRFPLYGIVDFDRQLTEAEIEQWQLVPVSVEAPPLPPRAVDVQHETAYGHTVRLSRPIRVF